MTLPFDLNNLFNLQYSFDTLKQAIQYLADQQGQQQILINSLLERPYDNYQVLGKKEKYLAPVDLPINMDSSHMNSTKPSANETP